MRIKKWWADGVMQRPAPVGDEQPNSASQQCKDQTLRHEFTHQPVSIGADRRRNSKLAFARAAPREQKICQIHTRDEKHESDDRHQDTTGQSELVLLIDSKRGGS